MTGGNGVSRSGPLEGVELIWSTEMSGQALKEHCSFLIE